MQADEGTSTEQDAAAEEGRSAPAQKSMMTRILAIAISSVIAVFFIYSLYGDLQQRDLISREVADKLRSSGSLAADSLGNWLQARLKLTELAADGIAVGDTSPAAASFELGRKTLLDSFDASYLGDIYGRFTQQPPWEDMPATYDPRKRPWYQQAEQAKSSVITPPYKSANSDDLNITVAVPVYQNGS